ncbi:dipicolinate synthase subunit A [Virgibacillus natechei]|uniref:Dipicolinate synthase subunit A n=1 Tax=Virgibacillus natechei TaxID=1216297 RepID=A0ABS4IE58_9BACI|nr:dipicolinate synthase subunit DpsA [Virgibacillus natechei]MBP1969143.1 dipicolinate synthase subunit A [Virgibacillus natechei]UZD14404.1 dipicolinate synthase subunit DpsA [Virgibacillus natechei]
MVNNQNILIMGGDARYLEVIKRLSKDGANVFLIGFDQLSFDDTNIKQSTLETMDFSMLDAITLPVAGTNTAGEIEATYSDQTIYLTKNIIAESPADCTIYTGTSNPFLDNLAKSTNRKLVRLFARDDMAILNSIPTAEGALRLAMEEKDITIHGSHVMVLGFGRVGITVARLFSSVGANVRVAVRKSSDISRIIEMGLEPVRLENLDQSINDIDICMNTIPYPVIDSTIISSMKSSALIIDLASKPGGTDFTFADNQGIQSLHALGLPGKSAPKSAGRIIAGVLAELLDN